MNLETMLLVLDAAITGDDPILYGRAPFNDEAFASGRPWTLSGAGDSKIFYRGRLHIHTNDMDHLDRFELPRFNVLKGRIQNACRDILANSV